MGGRPQAGRGADLPNAPACAATSPRPAGAGLPLSHGRGARCQRRRDTVRRGEAPDRVLTGPQGTPDPPQNLHATADVELITLGWDTAAGAIAMRSKNVAWSSPTDA